MSPPVNLPALVREVCAASDAADPSVLADEVFTRIPRKDQAAVLRQCLRTVVVQVLGQLRMSHQVPPTGQMASEAHDMSAGGGSSSQNVKGIRERWRAVLRDRIAVGHNPSEWKFLADCTEADLAFAAQLREDNARRNAAAADTYRNLAKLLAEHGVDTVGELPAAVLETGLGDQ